MLRYPIRAVSKITGISTDTLRAWERRYHAITPTRDTRGRLYSEADVARLRLLQQAVEGGHAIGRLAPMTSQEIESLVRHAARSRYDIQALRHPPSVQPSLGLLVSLIQQMDYVGADREFWRLVAILPPRDLVYQVVQPLLHTIGEGWHEGRVNIAQEHMASGIMRSSLGALVRLHMPSSPTVRLLFATPAGELHEFGILMSAILAASGGLGPVYLGANLPAVEIARAAGDSSAQAVVLGTMGVPPWKEILHQLQRLSRELPKGVELWVGGTLPQRAIRPLEASGALFLKDLESFEHQLIRLGARF